MRTASLPSILASLAVLLVGVSGPAHAATADRPNILWVTCEDMGPYLGCYGDSAASTPVLDALATQSVRYTQAFAYTGVCAPSRSCLITGVYPTRLGSHHMRSTTRLPDEVKCFPEYLRAAGYYCSNNVKTDYNFPVPKEAWDESSQKAHWRKRRPDQPFFAVFNFTSTHQSRVFGGDDRRDAVRRQLKPGQAHADGSVKVPPIHPDTPEFRREWAWYYDNVSLMDAQVGEILRQLEADGLADETIVFFFADNGTGLPSIKMWAWDASLRVPLLVRFPPKWRHLAPAAPGGTTASLVSFVDFAPTVLSVCGLDIPRHMQGVPFLGRSARPRQQFAGGKDRQGECYDTIRYVHDGRFHYLRNFQPHLPWSQFMSYNAQHPSLQSWEKLREAGKLSGVTARFFQTKPAEELYDVEKDPWETSNLAGDSRFTGHLQRLRAACEDWMRQTGDLGLLPEYELHRRAAGRTPYEIALDARLNPLPVLLEAARLANERDPRHAGRLVELLRAGDAAVRWWGATGLVALGTKAAPARAALRAAARDDSPDVRLAAADALANLGEDAEALALVREGLSHESILIRLAALNVARRLGARATTLLPAIRAAARVDPAHKDASDYVARMVEYLPAQIEAAAAR